jgi:hypothetical protein
MRGDEVNVAAQGPVEDVHVSPQLLEFLPGREGIEVLFGRQDLKVLFGHQGWQNLLYAGEPLIKIFETLFKHGVVSMRSSPGESPDLRCQAEMSERTPFDVGALHPHLLVHDSAPVVQEIIVVRRQEMA